MARYVAGHGKVLVIQWPVEGAATTSAPEGPPIIIGPPPAQTMSMDARAYVVYEPYGVQAITPGDGG